MINSEVIRELDIRIVSEIFKTVSSDDTDVATPVPGVSVLPVSLPPSSSL